ncbi:thymidylate kinase [Infundibulicybe gibba]|nr:thymidylate kinase [Infundibulicybe gibba]
MSEHPKRGPLIVIEGLDRSGKTTQTAALLARLTKANNTPTKLFKFPDRTTRIGKEIDAYLHSTSELDDHVIHLLFSANRWELASTIDALLLRGTAVVCDRYAFSGIAFSASKGLPLAWCRAPDVGLPAPDLTVFLDITPAQAKRRGGYGEERYEREEMQARVREIFGALGEEMAREGKWAVVDAGMGEEQVSEQVWGLVGPLIGGIEGPIQRLWVDGS